MERKTKTVYQLDTPFTKVQWPEISIAEQETILELLCSLLAPIGQHRLNYVTPSKGKRTKRKRRGCAIPTTSTAQTPAPEISSFVRVGLNVVARDLEALARQSRPPKTDEVDRPQTPENFSGVEDSRNDKRLAAQPPQFSAIFVLPSTEPNILYTHLAQLIATASAANPDTPSIRLVPLPRGSSSRLSRAIALPRISVIGLLDAAPHSAALVKLFRDRVPEIHVPWIQEAQAPVYLPIKINAIDTVAPVAKRDTNST